MQELFKAAVERGASDIHIKAGDFMRARIHGELQPLTQQKLTLSSSFRTRRIATTSIASSTTTAPGAFRASGGSA